MVSLFAEILDAPVVVEEADPNEFPTDLSLLHPDEAAMMVRAVDKRRREFTAARVLARRAFRRLGGEDMVLLHDEQRVPIWPEGFVGSITHKRDWCAVAMASASDVRAVGIDVEEDTPLEERLWDSVCTPKDLAWLRSLPADQQRRAGKALFSAKECAYKAQYLLTGNFLGFQAMSVVVEGQRWAATFEQTSGEFAIGDTLRGRLRRSEGLVATSIQL